ncbi:MAG TPA: RICIN domain-containing protein [Streptosporangiaceae bacterium]|jgi:hypothetical protein
MRFYLKAAGLLAAAMIPVGLTGAAAPASASSYFTISSAVNFGICLQGAAAADGSTNVIMANCNSNFDAQQWTPVSQGGDVFKFQNKAFGTCMDAFGGAANGTPIKLWPCTSNISNERWAWDRSFPAGFWPIGSRVSGSTGFCLDVPGAQANPGSGIQIWSCNGTNAQGWEFATAGGEVAVPNVLGLPQADAESTLTSMGLAVGAETFHNDCASPGDVETQNPSAGVEVVPGTAVSMTISTCSGGSPK